MSDQSHWSGADEEAYKSKLSCKRCEAIPLLEMVKEGKATFAMDVNGKQFTAPPKPMSSGLPLFESSLASSVTQTTSSYASLVVKHQLALDEMFTAPGKMKTGKKLHLQGGVVVCT